MEPYGARGATGRNQWQVGRAQKPRNVYESFGFKTVGTTSVRIAEKEVGEDLVMVLDSTAMREKAARSGPRSAE